MRRQKRISCYLPSVCRSGDRVNPLGEHRLQGNRMATIMLTAVAGTSCCLLICRHGKSNFCIRLWQINPTGKSLLIFRNRVKPRLQKYFCFPLTQISSLIRTVSFRQEGRIAIVTNAGRDAVDAGSACDERADADGEVVWFRRPNRWRQACEKKRRRRCQKAWSPRRARSKP